jgi:hypothetical protein
MSCNLIDFSLNVISTAKGLITIIDPPGAHRMLDLYLPGFLLSLGRDCSSVC